MTKHEQLERLRLRLKRLNNKIRQCKTAARQGFKSSEKTLGSGAVSSFRSAQKNQRLADDYKCRARHTHLAANYVLGHPLSQVERVSHSWPRVDYVLRNFKEVGIPVTDELVDGVTNWFQEHLLQLEKSAKQLQFETEELVATCDAL